MDAEVIDLLSQRPKPPKALTPRERLQCLIQATMNDEKAELCRADQQSLKAFFQSNAELFRTVAAK